MEHDLESCCCVECCIARQDREKATRSHVRTPNIRRVKRERRYHDRRDDEERRQLPETKLVQKILVTGDREWDDITRVVEELKGYRPGTVLIHGACRGADVICAAVAEALGFVVRGYPADWTNHGKGAGPRRNQLMLDVENTPESPIDLCLAFHNNIDSSRGTADMIKRVQKVGVAWKLNTSHPRSSVELEHLPAKEGAAGSSPAGDTTALDACTRQKT